MFIILDITTNPSVFEKKKIKVINLFFTGFSKIVFPAFTCKRN